MFLEELDMFFECALPTGSTVCREPVHGFRDSLRCHADTCLDQTQCKRLCIFSQTILACGEDKTFRECGKYGLICLERRSKRVGRSGIANLNIGIQLLRLGAFDPKFVSLQLR